MKKLAEENYPSMPNTRRNQLTVAAIAFLVLLISTIAAWPGTITGWELQAFIYINNGSEALHILARIVSDLVWVAVFLVAALFLFRRYRLGAWRIAVPAVLTYITVFSLEIIVGRARPEVLLQGEALVRAVQDGMGYPSGHVATLTAIIATIWPHLSWPLRILAVVLIPLEGWSRMYLGLHFPLDVIGGVAAGVFIAVTIKALPYSWLQKLRLAT